MFTRGLLRDLIEAQRSVDVAVVDIDQHALALAEGIATKMVNARKAPIRIEASTDRRDVFDGATVAIGTIGVGGRRAWEHDVFMPRKYGIFQRVGDTVMPAQAGLVPALNLVAGTPAISSTFIDVNYSYDADAGIGLLTTTGGSVSTLNLPPSQSIAGAFST